VEPPAGRPRSARELAAGLPVRRPAVSPHLNALTEGGPVRDRADGTRRIRHLDPHGFAGLRAYPDRFWTDALTTVTESAEPTKE
jgi:DNA-binding transcriptional ArsR family regulator